MGLSCLSESRLVEGRNMRQKDGGDAEGGRERKHTGDMAGATQEGRVGREATRMKPEGDGGNVKGDKWHGMGTWEF